MYTPSRVVLLAVVVASLAVDASCLSWHTPSPSRHFFTKQQQRVYDQVLDDKIRQLTSSVRHTPVPPSLVPDDPIADIIKYVSKTLKYWQIPAAAVAIVKGNQTLLAEGFGYKDLETSQPATADTLFAIASCTKAFTSVTYAILNDTGAASWNTRVGDVLPYFELQDNFATVRMTPLDLVSHRSGMSPNDLIWYGNANESLSQIDSTLRYLSPVSDFRTTFIYNNIMVATVGLLIEAAADGATYEDVVSSLVFQRLNMTSTRFSHQGAHDYAVPYAVFGNNYGPVAIPFMDVSNIAAAGAINSNANDMAKWLLMHLNGGISVETGEQVISAETLAMLHTTSLMSSQNSFVGWFPFLYYPSNAGALGVDYGFGWMLTSYRGRPLLMHPGNIDGFSSVTLLLPADSIGISILTNLDSTFGVFAAAFYAVDTLLSLPSLVGRDWNEFYDELASAEQQAALAAMQQLEHERVLGTQPSHSDLSDYTGTYANPAYGELVIGPPTPASGGNLTATFHVFNEMPLMHWQYDTFMSVPENTYYAVNVLFTFSSNPYTGSVDTVTVPFDQVIEFTRVN